jgi:hypothetical protein
VRREYCFIVEVSTPEDATLIGMIVRDLGFRVLSAQVLPEGCHAFSVSQCGEPGPDGPVSIGQNREAIAA